MRSALQALNQLVVDRVIEAYAIGGAIGASFYLEAMQTEDVDAFVFLPPSDSILETLTPVYEALQAMGGKVEGEYVRFGDWPVQVLSDSNTLIAEAIRDANSVDYDGVQTRVFRAEHLCAIALQVGRRKDLLRVEMFLEQKAVDREALSRVLRNYGLMEHAATLLPSHFNDEGWPNHDED